MADKDGPLVVVPFPVGVQEVHEALLVGRGGCGTDCHRCAGGNELDVGNRNELGEAGERRNERGGFIEDGRTKEGMRGDR